MPPTLATSASASPPQSTAATSTTRHRSRRRRSSSASQRTASRAPRGSPPLMSADQVLRDAERKAQANTARSPTAQALRSARSGHSPSESPRSGSTAVNAGNMTPRQLAAKPPSSLTATNVGGVLVKVFDASSAIKRLLTTVRSGNGATSPRSPSHRRRSGATSPARSARTGLSPTSAGRGGGRLSVASGVTASDGAASEAAAPPARPQRSGSSRYFSQINWAHDSGAPTRRKTSPNSALAYDNASVASASTAATSAMSASPRSHATGGSKRPRRRKFSRGGGKSVASPRSPERQAALARQARSSALRKRIHAVPRMLKATGLL